jgi:hypothetical protein
MTSFDGKERHLTSQFADSIVVVQSRVPGRNTAWLLIADGIPIATASKWEASGWAASLMTPAPTELLEAGSRIDVLGLALRTANALCAKAAFG